MSRVGIQQLQMLIFFLAFFHVLSSFLTFALGTAKVTPRFSYNLSSRASNIFRIYKSLIQQGGVEERRHVVL